MSEVDARPSILVVEDENDVRELLALRFGREGYRVTETGDGAAALERLTDDAAGTYDLVVLDWMLPRMSGIDLLRRMRQELRSAVPVLMVTARAEPAEIVLGLEAGADDYVTKPFDASVLLSRVRALLRRTREHAASRVAEVPASGGAAAPAETLQIGELRIDLAAFDVSCHGEPVSLTASEFRLLTVLAQNPGRVLTRDKLIDLVRGENVTIVGRAIDTHVFGLRKKLGRCADVIETIRGVGYRVRGT